jgi:hypothetical protein
MIKTFEEFTLNEAQGQFGDLDKNFYDKYIDIEHDCLMSNIDIVKYFGGKVPARENDTVRVYASKDHSRINTVYVDFYTVKQNSEEDFPVLDPYKNDNGEYFVAIDKDGNEINFDPEIVPMSELFFISDYLNSYYLRNRNKK